MSDILFHYYRVNPTTWFYLSSLLAIALFFKFSRVLSVRNLDLAALLLQGFAQCAQFLQRVGAQAADEMGQTAGVHRHAQTGARPGRQEVARGVASAGVEGLTPGAG